MMHLSNIRNITDGTTNGLANDGLAPAEDQDGCAADAGR
eukprot:COSAG02_NODE_5005_length_4726_cov_78.139615_5_plen_39_part_00